jgi:hypothetical protein
MTTPVLEIVATAGFDDCHDVTPLLTSLSDPSG